MRKIKRVIKSVKEWFVMQEKFFGMLLLLAFLGFLCFQFFKPPVRVFEDGTVKMQNPTLISTVSTDTVEIKEMAEKLGGNCVVLYPNEIRIYKADICRRKMSAE